MKSGKKSIAIEKDPCADRGGCRSPAGLLQASGSRWAGLVMNATTNRPFPPGFTSVSGDNVLPKTPAPIPLVLAD